MDCWQDKMEGCEGLLRANMEGREGLLAWQFSPCSSVCLAFYCQQNFQASVRLSMMLRKKRNKNTKVVTGSFFMLLLLSL